MAIIRAPKSRSLTSLERAAVSADLALKQAKTDAMKVQTIAGVLGTVDLAMDNKLLNAAGKRVAGLFDSDPTLEEVRASFGGQQPQTTGTVAEAAPAPETFSKPMADKAAATEALAGMTRPDFSSKASHLRPPLPPSSALSAAVQPPGAEGLGEVAPRKAMQLEDAPAQVGPGAGIMTSSRAQVSPLVGPNVSSVPQQREVLREFSEQADAGPYQAEVPPGPQSVQDRLTLARKLLKERSAPTPLPPDDYLEIAPTNALIRLAATPRSAEDMAVLDYFIRKAARAGEIMGAPGAQSAGPGFLTELIGGGAADRASAMLNALQSKTRTGMKEQDAWKVAKVLSEVANKEANVVLRMSKAHKVNAEIMEIEELLQGKDLLAKATAYQRLQNGDLAGARANKFARKRGALGKGRRNKNTKLFDWTTVKVGKDAELNNTIMYNPAEGFPKMLLPNGKQDTVFGVLSRMGLVKNEYKAHINAAKGAGTLSVAMSRAATADETARRAMSRNPNIPKVLKARYERAVTAFNNWQSAKARQLASDYHVSDEMRANVDRASIEYLNAAVAMDEWREENKPPEQPKPPAQRANPDSSGPKVDEGSFGPGR